MAEIQQDLVDVFARKQAPLLIKIAEISQAELSQDELKDYETLAKLLKDWDGHMGVESVQATVYTYVLHEFLMSLFHVYAPNHPSNRVAFLDGYTQTEFILTLLNSIAKEGTNPKYVNICKGAHPDYEGKNVCGYNVAVAFSKAKKFLEQNVS